MTGDWVAGFIDGEGCFHGGHSIKGDGTWTLVLSFTLRLRADDEEILHLMCEFLGFGHVGPAKVYGASNPQVVYQVTKLDELEELMVFFDNHPLRAKKRIDLELFREMVTLCREARNATPEKVPGKPKARRRWTMSRRKKFEDMCAEMKELHAFS